MKPAAICRCCPCHEHPAAQDRLKRHMAEDAEILDKLAEGPSTASVHRKIVKLLVPLHRRPGYRLTVWRLRFRNWRLSRV